MRTLMLLLPAVAALASCTFGPEARVEIQLPPLPEAWRAAFPGLRCLIVCPDGSGEELSTLLSGWDSGAVVSCNKANNTPVLAWPVSPGDLGSEAVGPGALRPAGGSWPGSLVDRTTGGVLRLTWTDGAAATVLMQLRSVGRDIALFNAERLSESLRSIADPWDLDLTGMAEGIARGDFSIYDIRELPRRDVTVAAGAGDWVLESPFRGPATAGADGAVPLAGMSRGTHFLFSLDGRVVRVEVRERETITLRIR